MSASMQRGAREVWPEPLLLVLEVHEDIGHASKPANRLRPALDVRLLISLVAQPEVAVVGGDLDRRMELLAVGDAQRDVAAT